MNRVASRSGSGPEHGIRFLALFLLLIWFPIPRADAQVALDWSAWASGGGVSTSGAVELSGTIGVQEAGQIRGAGVAVQGGFWNPLSANLVPVSITQEPQSRTVTAGQSVSFTVIADGSAPLSYQWRYIGKPIPGATNSIFSLANAKGTDAGIYDVVVSNPVRSVTSLARTLTVLPAPEITVQPQVQTVVVNELVRFNVSVAGVVPTGLQWRFDGEPIRNATNSDLTLPRAQLTDAGSYDVLVFNSGQTLTSRVATLTVLAPPVRRLSTHALAADVPASVSVSIQVSPAPGVSTFSVVEQPPPGWLIGGISDAGAFASNEIRWGPFTDQSPRTLEYTVSSSKPANDLAFAGRADFNGHSATIRGDSGVAVLPHVWEAKRIGDDLFIFGEDSRSDGDAILIEPGSAPDQIQVTFDTTNHARHLVEFVSTSQFGQIFIFGLQGNDTLQVSNNIALPVEIDGGQGDDMIRGGAGNDVLFGDAGNDFLDGGPGRNVINTGAGINHVLTAGDDDLTLNFQDTVELAALFPGSQTASIDWGDGIREAAQVDQSSGSVTGLHRYDLASAGTISIGVTTIDGDGTAADHTFAATVLKLPLSEAPGPLQLRAQKDGGLRLSFTGVPGDIYIIEATVNLLDPNWQPIASELCDPDGMVIFDIPASALLQSQFLRAIAEIDRP